MDHLVVELTMVSLVISVTRWLNYFNNFGESKINILPNTKLTLKNLPKTYKIVPKWRNFVQYGHTVGGQTSF